DYVAFGPMFPTPTKPLDYVADLGLISWWSELMEVPVVAIGGITPANCPPLVQAGADFLAVISAVWDHPEGPAAAVKAFNQAISAA
ncbi:thiamine phosphate synthase, partial [Acinetobacter baumannii]